MGVGVWSWSWRVEGSFFYLKFLTQRRRGAEYAEGFIAACGRIARATLSAAIPQPAYKRAQRATSCGNIVQEDLTSGGHLAICH